MRALWIRKIQRKNFTPGKYSRVCIEHFSQEHIEYDSRCQRDDGSWLVVKKRTPTLTADAFPSIFKDCPTPTDLTNDEPPAKIKTPPERNSAEQWSRSRDDEDVAFQVIFLLLLN